MANGSESSGYSVHGCVHSWMIHVLNDENEQDLAALAIKCTSLHVWPIQRRLLLHADRCWQLVGGVNNDEGSAWSSYNLAALYADQGRLKEAEAMYERALQGKEKAWGLDHTSTLDTVNNLGNLYKNQGRLKEAEAMYERALQGYETALGKHGIETYVPFLNALTNLGRLFALLKQEARAKQCFERALVGVRKVFGDGSDRAKQLERSLRH